MELDWPTPVTLLPLDGACALHSLPTTQRHLPPSKALAAGVCRTVCGTIQGKEGGIQVLAGLAPSIQTVGSNIRVIHEQVKQTAAHQ
jgi:hypothetical protein